MVPRAAVLAQMTMVMIAQASLGAVAGMAATPAAHTAIAPVLPVPSVIIPTAMPVFQATEAAPVTFPRGGFSPAPMPDPDSAAPAGSADPHTTFAPVIYGQARTFSSDSAAQGSTQHGRLTQPATGVAMNVPLN